MVAAKLFGPDCYLGGWTACEHWDLTDHSPPLPGAITRKEARWPTMRMYRALEPYGVTRVLPKSPRHEDFLGKCRTFRGRPLNSHPRMSNLEPV